MAVTHDIERKGFEILKTRLEQEGRTFRESDDRTYDAIVDGEYAEVKTKSHGWDKFDFVALTKNQKAALGEKLKKIFLVLNVEMPDRAEILEIDAKDLMQCKCREIVHYEWNKGDLQNLRNEK